MARHHSTRSTLALLLALLSACGGGSSEPPLPPPPPPPPGGAFVHASGRNLVLGTAPEPVHLRGVAFSNAFWSDAVPTWHNDGRDYQRVRDMGMNVVRFYLNAAWLQDPAAPITRPAGWQWIDQNILWAREAGVRLILDIHAPFGGYQSDGWGRAFWTDAANQDRFVALWRAIASRYRDDPTIAAYDLLNEPLPPDSVDQWKRLAQRTLEAIRSVDPNHLVVIEKVLGVQGHFPTYDDAAASQFLVDDPAGNVMYDFHFYIPWDYVYQHSYLGFGEGGTYPDESRPVVSPLSFSGIGAMTPRLASGTTGWTLLESQPLAVADAAHTIAVPALVAFAARSGIASFDGLTVNEYDSGGAFVREVVAAPDIEVAADWQLFAPDRTGSLAGSTAEPHAGSALVTITGTTGMAAAFDTRLAFLPRDGYRYAISGWVKGSSIPAGATAGLAIALFPNPTGAPIPVRNKAYLEQRLLQLAAFGEKHQVPMNVGEFGLQRECFEGGRGGLQYVEDLLGLFIAHDLSFTLHSYHEENFGLYYGDAGLPDLANANDALIQLFTRVLTGS